MTESRWRECPTHGIRWDGCRVEQCPMCRLVGRVRTLENSQSDNGGKR